MPTRFFCCGIKGQQKSGESAHNVRSFTALQSKTKDMPRYTHPLITGGGAPKSTPRIRLHSGATRRPNNFE